MDASLLVKPVNFFQQGWDTLDLIYHHKWRRSHYGNLLAQ